MHFPALDRIVEIPVKYFSPAVHWISIWGRDSVILSSVDMRYLMKAGSSKYLDLDLLAMFWGGVAAADGSKVHCQRVSRLYRLALQGAWRPARWTLSYNMAFNKVTPPHTINHCTTETLRDDQFHSFNFTQQHFDNNKENQTFYHVFEMQGWMIFHHFWCRISCTYFTIFNHFPFNLFGQETKRPLMQQGLMFS